MKKDTAAINKNTASKKDSTDAVKKKNAPNKKSTNGKGEDETADDSSRVSNNEINKR